MSLDPTGVMPDTMPKILLVVPAEDPSGVQPPLPAIFFSPAAVVLEEEEETTPEPTPTPTPATTAPPRLTVRNLPKRLRRSQVVLRGAVERATSLEIYAGRNLKRANLVRRVRLSGRTWKAEVPLDLGPNVFTVIARNSVGSDRETVSIRRVNPKTA